MANGNSWSAAHNLGESGRKGKCGTRPTLWTSRSETKQSPRQKNLPTDSMFAAVMVFHPSSKPFRATFLINKTFSVAHGRSNRADRPLGSRVPSDAQSPADGRAHTWLDEHSGRTQLWARPSHPAPAEALDTSDPVSRGRGGAPGMATEPPHARGPVEQWIPLKRRRDHQSSEVHLGIATRRRGVHGCRNSFDVQSNDRPFRRA
jgi:hypothetical protein